MEDFIMEHAEQIVEKSVTAGALTDLGYSSTDTCIRNFVLAGYKQLEFHRLRLDIDADGNVATPHAKFESSGAAYTRNRRFK